MEVVLCGFVVVVVVSVVVVSVVVLSVAVSVVAEWPVALVLASGCKMLCRNPYLNAQGMLFPCGQCMHCRINRGRLWTHRIMLESYLRMDNCFISLSYRDEALPICATGLPTLSRSHFTLWLKRYREEIYPSKIRFYGVGEYGERTWRPHYHVIVFGQKMCDRGRTLKDPRTGRPLWEKCCDQCRLIGKTWGKGDVDLGEVNVQSARYVSNYVIKRLTDPSNLELQGREPEFGTMSRHPGIGADMMHDVGSSLMYYDLEKKLDDVPHSLRHGGQEMPLGRYLRGHLRKVLGRDEKAPEATIKASQEKLQPMRETAFENSRSFKQEVVDAHNQAALNSEYRRKIMKKRGVL